MKKQSYILLVFLTMIFCNSCRVISENPSDWGWGFKPKPLTGMRNFPSLKTQYGIGFRDGCESALNASAKGLAADLSQERYDFVRSKKSSDYGTGWFDGLEQCTYIIDWDVL